VIDSILFGVEDEQLIFVFVHCCALYKQW